MVKFTKRKADRVRNLVILLSLMALIVITSTYAWFIGMRTVNVSSFDVEIATTDSLMLSLNGVDWDTTVSINSTNYSTASYGGNSNSWTDIIPVSSIGNMDVLSSRMELFEKASLTATAGGYRLMASQIDNYTTPFGEEPGYVVFDLFVKNFSGTQYIEALNTLDEEAIYLTTDSAVVVAADGVANTGIENSVRVAFGQIGRVIGTETTELTITGIKCDPGAVGDGNVSISGGVTGICRTAQIWEPNDTDHVANAISWYDTSCLQRDALGTDITLDTAYNQVSCGAVADGTAYPTYAIKEDIVSLDNVDIYDGAAYNSYTGTTELEAYDYFTDTEKDLTGTDRPTFMTLAPNSITKVRIYIYIEGQDVDNYDFASIGHKISVNFGLTKERFTEGDIGYTGPELNNPSITLLGLAAMSVPNGGPYTDPGATAWDSLDGDITGDIVVAGDTVDVNVAGDYVVTYDVQDSDGNNATQVTRTVTVLAP